MAGGLRSFRYKTLLISKGTQFGLNFLTDNYGFGPVNIDIFYGFHSLAVQRK